MAEPILYAKAGGPPRNWSDLDVVDLETRSVIGDVIECDARNGWLIRFDRGPDGRFRREGSCAARVRVEGRFAIVPRESEVDHG